MGYCSCCDGLGYVNYKTYCEQEENNSTSTDFILCPECGGSGKEVGSKFYSNSPTYDKFIILPLMISKGLKKFTLGASNTITLVAEDNSQYYTTIDNVVLIKEGEKSHEQSISASETRLLARHCH